MFGERKRLGQADAMKCWGLKVFFRGFRGGGCIVGFYVRGGLVRGGVHAATDGAAALAAASAVVTRPKGTEDVEEIDTAGEIDLRWETGGNMWGLVWFVGQKGGCCGCGVGAWPCQCAADAAVALAAPTAAVVACTELKRWKRLTCRVCGGGFGMCSPERKEENSGTGELREKLVGLEISPRGGGGWMRQQHWRRLMLLYNDNRGRHVCMGGVGALGIAHTPGSTYLETVRV